jgi:hypothetical protein
VRLRGFPVQGLSLVSWSCHEAMSLMKLLMDNMEARRYRYSSPTSAKELITDGRGW